jgi:hypothetical protein
MHQNFENGRAEKSAKAVPNRVKTPAGYLLFAQDLHGACGDELLEFCRVLLAPYY